MLILLDFWKKVPNFWYHKVEKRNPKNRWFFHESFIGQFLKRPKKKKVAELYCSTFLSNIRSYDNHANNLSLRKANWEKMPSGISTTFHALVSSTTLHTYLFVCMQTNWPTYHVMEKEWTNGGWGDWETVVHQKKKEEANGLHHATSSTIYKPNSLRNIERKKSIDLAKNWSGKNGITHTHHRDYYILDNKLRLLAT